MSASVAGADLAHLVGLESVDGRALQFVGVLGDQPLAVPAE